MTRLFNALVLGTPAAMGIIEAFRNASTEREMIAASIFTAGMVIIAGAMTLGDKIARATRSRKHSL